MLCTAARAKKVVVCLTIVSLTVPAILYIRLIPAGLTVIILRTYDMIFSVLMPVAILVINLIVVREVRRASHNASVNLGRHQPQQSSSAVPTAMLVTTSLVYVLLAAAAILVYEFKHWIPLTVPGTNQTFFNSMVITSALKYPIFAYNFYIYLITGRQFRSNLCKLLYCFCRRSSVDAGVARQGQNNTAIELLHNSV